MPRLISTKRFRKLVEAEKVGLSQRKLVAEPKSQPPTELIERLKSCEESNENLDEYNAKLGRALLVLAKILNPATADVQQALELAAKFKK